MNAIFTATMLALTGFGGQDVTKSKPTMLPSGQDFREDFNTAKGKVRCVLILAPS